MRAFLALMALAVVAAPAFAQVTLRPGHPDLLTAGLSLDTETVRVRVTEPRPTDLGLVATTVERDGDTITMRTNADVPRAGQVYDVTVSMAWPTLAPIMRERSTSGSTGMTRYDGTTVTGTYGRGDWEPLPFDITLPAEVFFPEALPVIARALPFAEGYTATVPTFTSERRIRDYTLTVTGQQDFERADGSTVTAWVVEETSQGRGSSARKYFVEDGTRILVASTTTAQGNTEVITEPVTEEMLAAMNAETPAVELRPGLDRLDLSGLTDYQGDYVVKIVQPIQQDAGTATRRLVVDEAAGTVTLTTTTVIAMAGQRTSETAVAAYPSLAPISVRSDNNGSITDLTYTADAVSGTKTEGEADPEPVEMAFEMPAYAGTWVFEIVRLVPFEEGWRGAVHTISSEDGPRETVVTVIGREDVDGVSAWIVEAQAPEGGPVEFAVHPDTREMLRTRLQPQAGVIVDIVPADAE
ncbi:hypothetical protein [Rubrivirga sp. IMCC45206]|uniref:hypothetical protein n=1 Tax=Rubrivirga sp. IMCC45206 TaxID=3391614 RepID=UPI00398FC2DC